MLRCKYAHRKERDRVGNCVRSFEVSVEDEREMPKDIFVYELDCVPTTWKTETIPKNTQHEFIGTIMHSTWISFDTVARTALSRAFTVYKDIQTHSLSFVHGKLFDFHKLLFAAHCCLLFVYRIPECHIDVFKRIVVFDRDRNQLTYENCIEKNNLILWPLAKFWKRLCRYHPNAMNVGSNNDTNEIKLDWMTSWCRGTSQSIKLDNAYEF